MIQWDVICRDSSTAQDTSAFFSYDLCPSADPQIPTLSSPHLNSTKPDEPCYHTLRLVSYFSCGCVCASLLLIRRSVDINLIPFTNHNTKQTLSLCRFLVIMDLLLKRLTKLKVWKCWCLIWFLQYKLFLVWNLWTDTGDNTSCKSQ